MHIPSTRRLALAAVLAALALTSAIYVRTSVAVALAAVTVGATVVAAPRPRWRRRALGVGFGVSLAAALVATGDLAARALLGRRLHYRAFEQYARKWPVDPRTTRFQPSVDDTRETHGDLAERTRDPAHAQRRVMRLRTDAWGFRNDAAPARDLDVIALGDSFALGEGTTQDETWAARLAQAGLETYNLGFPSGPGEQALRFAWEVDRLPTRPGTTVVWTIFAGNDLWDGHPDWREPLAPAPWLDQLVVRVQGYRYRSPLRTAFQRLPGDVTVAHDGRGPALFFGPYAERAALPVEALRALPTVPRIGQTFAWMRDAAARRGLGVLVVVAPDKSQVHPELLGRGPVVGRTPFAEVIEGLARGAGLPTLDLLPGLLAARDLDPEPLYWRDDTHWSPRGNREAARLIRERLLELGLSPATGPVADVGRPK